AGVQPHPQRARGDRRPDRHGGQGTYGQPTLDGRTGRPGPRALPGPGDRPERADRGPGRPGHQRPAGGTVRWGRSGDVRSRRRRPVGRAGHGGGTLGRVRAARQQPGGGLPVDDGGAAMITPSGVWLVTRQEFRVRLRTGRWRWLLAAWVVVLLLFM